MVLYKLATKSTNFIIKGYLDYRKFYGDGKNHVITMIVENQIGIRLNFKGRVIRIV